MQDLAHYVIFSTANIEVLQMHLLSAVNKIAAHHELNGEIKVKSVFRRGERDSAAEGPYY